MKLYDNESTLTFPNGKSYTAEELKAHPFYSRLFAEPYVLTYGVGGKVVSFQSLADMKEAYGVTADDPEVALAEIEAEIAKRQEAEVEQVNMFDAINQRLDEQDEALMELASLLG